MFDYTKVCSEILSDLPERQREVLWRRFGFDTQKRETLELIGHDFGITRERVRQIERDGLSKIEPKMKKYQKIVKYFTDHLKNTGDLRKEEILLSHLGKEKYQRQVFFLLTLAEPFRRFSETEEFHSVWTVNPNSFDRAKKVINSFYEKLAEGNQALTLADFKPPVNVSSGVLEHFLEISKIIQKNSEGLFGLKDWPEINPKSIKDKAFLALKKAGKPLHFREVARAIGPDALVQTVHNELIRDPRFVLVGRGLYALRDWGYKDGDVKDVISDILREAKRPLSKEDLIDNVFKQRLVKRDTILLNLSNKDYFSKTLEGKYQVKKS